MPLSSFCVYVHSAKTFDSCEPPAWTFRIAFLMSFAACRMHFSGRSTCRNDFDDLLDRLHSQRLGGAVA